MQSRVTATIQTGSKMVHGVMIVMRVAEIDSVVEIDTMTGIEEIVMMTEAAETTIVEVG